MNFKTKRLTNSTDTHFTEAWELYEKAFPIEERRLLPVQIHLLKKSKYHFDVIIYENNLIGFLLWWDFETLQFIDHFATLSMYRNKGFGKKILENFIKNTSKTVLLEVELPDSPINKRRIEFYKRIGFQLNSHYYETPDLSTGKNAFQLLLMSYPTKISSKNFEKFTKTYQPFIFENR